MSTSSACTFEPLESRRLLSTAPVSAGPTLGTARPLGELAVDRPIKLADRVGGAQIADVFRFNVTEKVDLSLALVELGGENDSTVQVLGPSGGVLTTAAARGGAQRLNLTVNRGTYYVRVISREPTEDTYVLDLKATRAATFLDLAAVAPLAFGNFFLQATGILGESPDARHQGWSDVNSWSWSLSVTPTTSPGSGAGTSVVTLSDFTIAKVVDKASPAFFRALVTGQRLAEVTLEMVEGGAGGNRTAMILRLRDVVITNMNQSGQPGDTPLETISFRPTILQIWYVPIRPDGSAAPGIFAAYNFATRRAT